MQAESSVVTQVLCVLCRAAAEDTKMGIQLGELCACTFKGFVLLKCKLRLSPGYASAVLLG